MSLTRQVRTLEVDLGTGQLLSEFRNTHDISDVVVAAEGVFSRLAIQTQNYFNQADFSCKVGQP
ncbi:MAG: hypothetical protein ACR2QG_13800 [Gammaproteobacteria bacterium]